VTTEMNTWTSSQLGVLPIEIRLPQNDPAPIGHSDAILSPEKDDYSYEGHVARTVRMIKNFAGYNVPTISKVKPIFSSGALSIRKIH